jgi:hypothetical protein
MNFDNLLTLVREYAADWSDWSLDLHLDAIKTATWHDLERHGDLMDRGLVYIVHDEWEVIYVGSTKKTVIERFNGHLLKADAKMVGPWGSPGLAEPKPIGYWLRKRRDRGCINFWVTTIPTRLVFGVQEIHSDDSVHAMTEGIERRLIDVLCPLINNTGPVDVLLNRYHRYDPWERRQLELEEMIVADQCDRCSKQRTESASGER